MKISSTLFLLLLALSIPAQAKVYMYVDADGFKGATDKREAIPPNAWITSVIDIGLGKQVNFVQSRKATVVETKDCFARHRNDFLDPKSAYPVTAQVIKYLVQYQESANGKIASWYETYVEVDVSAKNTYGWAIRRFVKCQIK